MTRRHWTGLMLGVALVALALVALGCGDDDSDGSGSGDDGGGSRQVVLGTQPWIGYGPLTAVAPNQGFFEEEGLDDVKIVNFKSDKDINAAFASKRLDAVSVGISQALTFAEAGVPIKIVLLEDVSTHADAILGRGVDSVADLRGKRVAVEEGTVGDMMLRYALQQEDMTIDDVDVVPLPAADAGTAIIAGRVDAAVTYEPYITEAQAKNDDIKPIFTAGEREGLISDMLIVREDVIEDDPDIVQGLVNAWGKSIDFYNSNTAQAQKLIADDLGSPLADLKTAFDGVTFFDIAQNQEQLNGPFPKLIGEVQDIMIDAGLMKNEVDTDALVDPAFVDKAAG
jgi:NitT/TauT family transport system substrate-binding protein